MFNASAVTETNTPAGLVANANNLTADKVTIPSGTAAMLRGTVLGKRTLGAASVAAKAGGNTGNGVFTLDATTPILNRAQVGVYAVRCIAAATNSGTFRVTDPRGRVLGDVVVGATFANDIKFAIADGATDFIVGDGFDVTIAAGDGKLFTSLAAALDGSQVPYAVLAEDTATLVADGEAIAYITGEFVAEDLILGAGHTVASIRDDLRLKGILIA